MFETWCNFSTTKIASSCYDKNACVNWPLQCNKLNQATQRFSATHKTSSEQKNMGLFISDHYKWRSNLTGNWCERQWESVLWRFHLRWNVVHFHHLKGNKYFRNDGQEFWRLNTSHEELRPGKKFAAWVHLGCYFMPIISVSKVDNYINKSSRYVSLWF